jgi:precorrin-3B methylase
MAASHTVVIKITGDNRVFHRVKVAPTVAALNAAATEAGLRGSPTYLDADGDQCVIVSSDVFGEALAASTTTLKVTFAAEAGKNFSARCSIMIQPPAFPPLDPETNLDCC